MERGLFDAYEYKAFIVEEILNRLESPIYPNTIKNVLEEKNAFQNSSEYTGDNIDSFYDSKVTKDTKQAVIYFLEHQNNFNHFYFFNHGNGLDKNYFGGDGTYFFDPDDTTNVLTRD